MFSNAAYIFLPILIGFSSAKVFGGNQFLGAVIAMIIYKPLSNMIVRMNTAFTKKRNSKAEKA